MPLFVKPRIYIHTTNNSIQLAFLLQKHFLRLISLIQIKPSNALHILCVHIVFASTTMSPIISPGKEPYILLRCKTAFQQIWRFHRTRFVSPVNAVPGALCWARCETSIRFKSGVRLKSHFPAAALYVVFCVERASFHLAASLYHRIALNASP